VVAKAMREAIPRRRRPDRARRAFGGRLTEDTNGPGPESPVRKARKDWFEPDGARGERDAPSKYARGGKIERETRGPWYAEKKLVGKERASGGRLKRASGGSTDDDNSVASSVSDKDLAAGKQAFAQSHQFNDRANARISSILGKSPSARETDQVVNADALDDQRADIARDRGFRAFGMPGGAKYPRNQPEGYPVPQGLGKKRGGRLAGRK
jgi:hypothetical protein